MKPISINIEGLPKAKKYISSKNSKVKSQLKYAMTKAGIFLQGEVKLSIAGKKAEYQSVDTGRFLNSVDMKSSSDNAIVYSNVPYAGHLEYGTNFKNSPRKHFRNSAARSKPAVVSILQKEINKI